MDKLAFRQVLGRLTQYALEKASREWEVVEETAAKARAEEEGGAEQLAELEAGEKEVEGEGKVCQRQCANSIRFGLPCRHIMWPYYREQAPIPAKVFHRRWFLDDENQRQRIIKGL